MLNGGWILNIYFHPQCLRLITHVYNFAIMKDDMIGTSIACWTTKDQNKKNTVYIYIFLSCSFHYIIWVNVNQYVSFQFFHNHILVYIPTYTEVWRQHELHCISITKYSESRSYHNEFIKTWLNRDLVYSSSFTVFLR